MTRLEMERRAAEWLGLDKNDPKFRRRLLPRAPNVIRPDSDSWSPNTMVYEFCPPEEWTPPAYGSDLNLWLPIYAKLDALSRLDEYAGQEPDRLFCEALEAIACERLKLVGYNAGLAYIGATAEDRLRALIAVITTWPSPSHHQNTPSEVDVSKRKKMTYDEWVSEFSKENSKRAHESMTPEQRRERALKASKAAAAVRSAKAKARAADPAAPETS